MARKRGSHIRGGVEVGRGRGRGHDIYNDRVELVE